MKIRRQRAGNLGQGVQTVEQEDTAAEQAKSKANNLGRVLGGDDVKVNLGVGQIISKGLDPQVLLSERAEKFERIKAAVKNGTYKVSSLEVAKAFVEEINAEVGRGGQLEGAFEE